VRRLISASLNEFCLWCFMIRGFDAGDDAALFLERDEGVTLPEVERDEGVALPEVHSGSLCAHNC
jgi:hypothetical protein